MIWLFPLFLYGCSHADKMNNEDNLPRFGNLFDIPYWQSKNKRTRSGASETLGVSHRQKNVSEFTKYGDGIYVRYDNDETQQGADAISKSGEDVEFAFIDVDVKQFARVVFDDILQLPYTIDQDFNRKITVRTGAKVPRSLALNIVTEVIENSGGSVELKNGVYFIRSNFGNEFQNQGNEAKEQQIISLNYVDTSSMVEALSNFGLQQELEIKKVGQGIILLIGQKQQIQQAQQLITALDIDALKGMSFGLFPLQNTKANILQQELEKLFTNTGRSSKQIQIFSIGRLNSLLIASRKSADLKLAKGWISRLDVVSSNQSQIHIYKAINRNAEELEKITKSLFGLQGLGGNLDTGQNNADDNSQEAGSQENSNQEGGFQDSGIGNQKSDLLKGNVTISVDKSINSLIVTASKRDYKIVEATLRKLDIQAKQVLIDVTIAEVQLNDELEHGVKWYFSSGNAAVGWSNGSANTPSHTYPGANFSFNAPNAQVVINALKSITDVEIVSTPTITVIDTQTAKLQIGDQVPVVTRTATGVTDPNAPIVNNVELKNTGVILSVTPQITGSGLVNLKIKQEASNVVSTTTSGIDSPTIRQRSIESMVSILDGEAVILGGLVTDQNSKSITGVPVLHEIPLVGNLFKSKSNTKQRSELIVIIRAAVIRNQREMNDAIRDLSTQTRRLHELNRR